MNQRLYRILTIGILSALANATTLWAQTSVDTQNMQTSSSASGTAILRGHVMDPGGALIPGAKIAITNTTGQTIATVVADSAGSYEVRQLEPGSYIVLSTADGFSPFSSIAIQLTSGQSKLLDLAMKIRLDTQTIFVTDNTPTVSVEADQNSSAIVLKGSDLDAMSDDPDELANELAALAGPAAGPNGGQIYIDGFTGGQLPPKSAIREIRINQNPFSAELDKIGYGRIEILTKPGTDQLHGEFFMQGSDNVFNTGNPFDPNVLPYHRLQYNGTIHGSLSKNASFFLSVEDRDNHDVQVYNYYPAVLNTTTNQYSISPTRTSGSLQNPHNRLNISPRIDLQLGQKNTFTMRYQFYYDTESGDIHSTQLPSQSVRNSSREQQLQISDSQIITDHIVNETRFQYVREISTQSPVGSDPTLQINGDFTGGSASSQSSRDHQDRFELQNLTTMSLGAHALKFGTRLRDNRDANSTNANFNGTFTFSESNYAATLTGLANGLTIAAIAAAGNGPSQLTYSTGPNGSLSPFSTQVNLFDAALFAQDDWKANKYLTLSGGLRWESQNHISDQSDWAPRAALAYALDGHHNNTTKTVLRAGYGIFYDRFTSGNLLSATQQNGNAATSLQQTYITNPTCFDTTILSTAGCGSSSNTASTRVQISPTYHSPYIQQFGVGLERQLTKTTTLTATYLHSFGVHQLVTRNSNTPCGPTFITPCGPNTAYNSLPQHIDQFYTEAVFKQDQIITNINARISPKLSIMGFYNFTVAKSDGSGGVAANPYDLGKDYGRARFTSRNMVFVTANYTAPWAIRLSPFLVAQSGKPFNIVLPNDLNQDGFFIDRPAYCSASTTDSVTNSYGCFDLAPPSGYTPIPVNLGTGPASVAFNLRVSRGVGFGPKLSATSEQNFGSSPPVGGGGRNMGGIFGGGGMMGMGGRGGGPIVPSDRRYTLNLSVQALNLFNNINYGAPNGMLGASNFGRSTSLIGGIFSSSVAARRVFFQTTLSF